MSHATCLMSESSSELSEAMIEYGRVFQKRTRADPTLSSNQVKDNARFRCYSHASRFWGDMSSMQMAVHQTLLKDYQHLNRQVATFFEQHSSDASDRETIGEGDKRLSRVEMVAGFRHPADLEHVRSKAPEDAHRNPDHHTYVPPRAFPVSGLTHGQIPHPLESPATYPGGFCPRWGETEVQISQTLREAGSGDQRSETLPEMRDNLMMFAKKHNDALRNLETDFLARIAVGLTNTSFDRLKDAYLKADDWPSLIGLQTYAGELRLGKRQTELNGSLEPSPPRSVIRRELIGDDKFGGFGVDGSTHTAASSGIGTVPSPGLFPGDFVGEGAGDGDDESESESESDGPVSDGSVSPKGSGLGPNGPGRNNPRPPGGNSGSNLAGGTGAGGHSNNSARGPGGSRSSPNSNSSSNYASSGSLYEGNRRLSEGLQASLSKQTLHELSDSGPPSVNSDSPSVLSRDSLSTTQTSVRSAGDLSKSPKGPSSEAATTPESSEIGAAKVALSKKDGNQKLSGTTFGINMSIGSKIVEGLESRVAQTQNSFVTPLEDTPMALSTLLEDSDEGSDQDSVDDHKVMRTSRKHRHLRRVPRFIIFQGGNLKVFGRHNAYTGTGLKAGSPARGQNSLQNHQRLGSSASLPTLSACDVAPQLASPLDDPGSNDFTTYGSGSGLFQKSAGVQATGTIPQ
ncbi:hypothetical protein HOY80DRAFT_938409 [Tuber brumale]|nr:hypothetical protein HOY80DRAFT_938409 [Tuber brumale]